MKYLILILAFVTTSVFANTVSSQQVPGTTLGSRFYIEDLEAIICINDGAGLEATCQFSNGSYQSATQEFVIVGAVVRNMNATTNLFYCLGYYSSSDTGSGAVNGSPAGDGIYVRENGDGATGLTWFGGAHKNCAGTSGDFVRGLFFSEIAEGGNSGTCNDQFGGCRHKPYIYNSLNFVVPINSRVMYSHGGGDNDGEARFYGYWRTP